MHYALSDFVLDIAQNSIEAGSASVTVRIEEDEASFAVTVSDDGRGMDQAQLKRALDPFYSDGRKHAGRRVGLGLPFLRQAVSMTGGGFAITSERGIGTTVSFSFPLANVDTPPVGDLEGLFVQLLAFDGDYEFVVERSKVEGEKSGSYRLVRSELIDALGDLGDSGSLVLLREFIGSQERSIFVP
jgi:hypothetical protein